MRRSTIRENRIDEPDIDRCSTFFDDKMPSLDDVLDHTNAGGVFLDENDLDINYVKLCEKRGLDPGEDHPEIREIVENAAKQRAMSVYENAVIEMRRVFNKNVATVYREIYVDDVDAFIISLEKHGKTMYRGKMTGVGTYWSWNFDRSFAYGASGRERKAAITIIATVTCDDVDLEMMIADYMIFSSEEEVNLLENRQITIENVVTRDGKSLTKGKPIVAWT